MSAITIVQLVSFFSHLPFVYNQHSFIPLVGINSKMSAFTLHLGICPMLRLAVSPCEETKAVWNETKKTFKSIGQIPIFHVLFKHLFCLFMAAWKDKTKEEIQNTKSRNIWLQRFFIYIFYFFTLVEPFLKSGYIHFNLHQNQNISELMSLSVIVLVS